jgi:hypothetical protein
MPPRRGPAALGSPILRIVAFAIALRVVSAGVGFFANVVFPLH